MSIFSRRKFLFEADGDEAGNETNTTDPNTGDGNSDNVDPNAGDSGDENSESNDTGNEDNSGEDEPDFGEDNQEEDFSIDSDIDADMEGDGSNDSSSSSDTSSSSSSNNEEETITVDKDSLKAKDKELFDSLSPEEQKMKIKTLKNLFVELYSNCDIIIDKFNSLSTEYDEANEQINRIISTIYCLKKMVSDYLLNKFTTASYIENDIMFNNYMAVMNSIKNISTDLKNIYNNDNLES